MRAAVIVFSLSALLCSCCIADRDAAKWTARRTRVYKDAVPDARTAIAIGEAVMLPVYGRHQVLSQRPQVAELQGDVWYVHGYQPPISAGGTAEAYIDKHTGRILCITDGGE